MQSATPVSSRKWPGSTGPLFPVMPMAVRPAPSMAWGVRPSSRTRASMAAWSLGETSGCSTISMASPRSSMNTADSGDALSGAEPIAGLEAVSSQERARAEALLALELQLGQLPDRAGAGRVDAVRTELDDLPRGLVGRLQDGLGGVDLQHLSLPGGPGAGPGGEAAAALVALVGGAMEIDPSVVAGEDGRQRGLGVVLGHAGKLAALEQRERLGQRGCAQGGELAEQRFRGLVRRDRQALLQADVSGVETFVHLHDGDAGLLVAARDRP